MKILLPESEGKIEGGKSVDYTIHSNTLELLERIKNYTGSLESLYGVKGNNLDLAIKMNAQIENSPLCKAVQRFSGVVYKALSYETLQNKNYADSHIYFVTSLFGLVRADALIPNYKLKINKLQADRLWLEENKNRIGDEFVVDLLPQAHRKSVSYINGIHVEFIIRQNGKKKSAGHAGKHIKGRFARFLVEKKITDPQKMVTFCEDGFVGYLSDDYLEFVKVLSL